MQIVVHAQIAKNVTTNRSCRRFKRNCGWWKTIWDTYSDERFRKNFCVTRDKCAYVNEKNRTFSNQRYYCRGSNLSKTKISCLFVLLW